jgi:anaerobic magnesium-protoporphyrin IX monomethyl ester cyclase
MMPHLALPSLTAYLRENGVEVLQRDLNAEVFDQVLSGRHLRTVQRQLRREKQRLAHRDIPPDLRQAKLDALAWAEQNGPQIVDTIDQAKSIVRSDAFFDPYVGLQAFVTLTYGLQLASALYYPSELRLLGYRSAHLIDASYAIRAAVEDGPHNLFRSLFQVSVIPQIRRERPDVIGISLTCADQVIAGFTLAALIKEAGLPAHVALGGKMITCWRDQLPRAEALWDLFDSAVFAEGEVALLRLIQALKAGPGLSAVPNLMYRDGTCVRVNEPKAPEPVDALPVPDFDGLPLDLYLAPERVLPIWASRGCYWGRCAFCNVGYGESKHFDEQAAERVASEMVSLAAKYDTRHFFFADEALSPRMLKALSALLIQREAGLDWACCARFEPGLNAGLLRQMRQAGCRMVLYGLESGSQRILDRMDKGTKLATAERILREGAEAGIWNHMFFFFGFPGETEQDAHETIHFFRANQHTVHSICTGTFLLERDSEVAADPARYGIARLIPPHPERDLAYYYEYEMPSGVSAERAEKIETQFIDSLSDKDAPHLYFHDIYRFLYACRFRASEPLPTMAE